MSATTDGESAHQSVILRARTEDASTIQSIVRTAYSMYIERIGREPAPMTANYADIIHTQEVYVLRVEDIIKGAIVLGQDTDSLKLNNLVVDPAAQGRGYGRLLISHAEDLAQARGIHAITLYANVKMHENIALYGKVGFTETGRRSEDGYDRVYFCKELNQRMETNVQRKVEKSDGVNLIKSLSIECR